MAMQCSDLGDAGISVDHMTESDRHDTILWRTKARSSNLAIGWCTASKSMADFFNCFFHTDFGTEPRWRIRHRVV